MEAALGKHDTKESLSEYFGGYAFSFQIPTHTYINANGKVMHYVHDLGWIEVSDDEVLIVRVHSTKNSARFITKEWASENFKYVLLKA